MKAHTLIAVAALIGAAPGVASARDPVVKAGVAVDELTPDGLTRSAVSVSSVSGAGVRLAYRDAQGRFALALEVRVAATAEDARTWLENERRAMTRTPPAVTDLGDLAYGEGRVFLFARANVAVAVRAPSRSLDPRAIAEKILAAIDAAPSGSPSSEIRLDPPTNLPVGVSVPLTLTGDPLDAKIIPHGPATVRRTASGFTVTRTGQGAVTFDLIAVDSRLRQ